MNQAYKHMDKAISHQPSEMGKKETTTSSEGVVAQSLADCLGQGILMALGQSGACYVSLPNSCALLDLNLRGQLQRIQRTPELVAGLRQLPLSTRGGMQRINCLQVDLVEAWLAGMHMRGARRILQTHSDAYYAALNEVGTH
jgi:hypothetical protein